MKLRGEEPAKTEGMRRREQNRSWGGDKKDHTFGKNRRRGRRWIARFTK